MLSARMASGMPRVSRSTTARVASGVTSLEEKPVPPVVSTRSTRSSSAHRISASLICSSSSGRMAVRVTSQPFSLRIPHRAGPLVSSRWPRAPLSLMVSTAAV